MTLSMPALAVVLLATMIARPAIGQVPAEVLKPAHEFMDKFNKGDTKGAGAACADAVAIVDEFAPFVWHGSGACAAWMKDYDGAVTINTDQQVIATRPHAHRIFLDIGEAPSWIAGSWLY